MTWKDVFLNPYKRMKRDFSFLAKAGFSFDSVSNHNIRPAIVFKKGDQFICVCYDYGIERFEVTYHLNNDDILGNSMLPINWEKNMKKNYQSQLSYVQNCIKTRLNIA